MAPAKTPPQFSVTVLICREPEVCCALERIDIPLQGLSFWESSPPMGPFESRTGQPENQEASRRKRLPRRPRMRRCLLKGCEQRFPPRQARQRYCSELCRESARRWSRWKAQQRYRTAAMGQQKRNSQSRRYRERIKSRKLQQPAPVNEIARVITTEHFFRPLLRPAGLLRGIRASAAKSLTTFLLAVLPARCRARPRTRATLEAVADLIPTY